MSDETFDIEVEVKRVTAKAVLVLAETGEEVWIPRSVITEDSDVPSDCEAGVDGTMTVKRWFAEKNDLA